MQTPFNNKFNKTKIVATIGPSSSDRKTLESLIENGVDVFRLNFSHADHQTKLEVIKTINEINDHNELPVSILADLQGPKIRIGEVVKSTTSENYGGSNLPVLIEGDEVLLTTKRCQSDNKTIYVNYHNLATEVEKNHRIFIDDGKIELHVIQSNGKNEVRAKVIYGGALNDNKGVNLPDTDLSVPCLTAKDLEDLEFILTQDINWIALSFVRSADDINKLKALIAEKNHHARVIAKIEKPEAITHLSEIIEATDAIMVARGDLGVEIEGAKVPMIQKDIILRCMKTAKPVIVATQMMESMVNNPKPTRAEINDIANAVLDGTDAVMLSGETAVGKYPVTCVEIMSKILRHTEKSQSIYHPGYEPPRGTSDFLSDSICYHATQLSEQVRAKAIIGMTISGYTAFKTSSHRPKSSIYIFTENKAILGTLSLVWGVRCFYYNNFKSTDNTVNEVKDFLQNKKLLRKGDVVINLGSMPLAEKGKTNMLRVSRIS